MGQSSSSDISKDNAISRGRTARLASSTCWKTKPVLQRYQKKAAYTDQDLNLAKRSTQLALSRCQHCVQDSMNLIQSCDPLACPKYKFDSQLQQFREINNLDPLTACQNYSCILDQQMLMLNRFKTMIERNRWTGIDDSKMGVPFTVDHYHELHDYISLVCYNRTQLIRDLILKKAF
jgi:hypothetical protein